MGYRIGKIILLKYAGIANLSGINSNTSAAQGQAKENICI